MAPFLAKGKPVFNVEYSKDYGVCPRSNELGIDTIFKVVVVVMMMRDQPLFATSVSQLDEALSADCGCILQ